MLYILPMYTLSRMNMEETESMNRTIISNETDKQKTPCNKIPASFTGELYQTFTEELTPVLFKLFHKFHLNRRTFRSSLPAEARITASTAATVTLSSQTIARSRETVGYLGSGV